MSNQSESARQETPNTISGIPLDVWPDVWFEDPLSVAENNGRSPNREIPPTAVASTNTLPVESASPSNKESDAAADRPKWASLLSGDDLKQETKEIRLGLKQAFQSVQRYNGHYKNVSVDGSVLAVLAMVVDEHTGRIVWKSKALSVRDLAAEMAAAASGLGRKHYDPALKIYEQIEQLLSGNTPGKLKPPAANASIDEFAPRGELMKRMQQSADRIQASAADENSFRAEAEQLRHESLMVALLAAVTSAEDYDMADEPEYAAQARSLIEAGMDAAQAAGKSDFATFSEARERMNKACAACHLDFRFDEE